MTTERVKRKLTAILTADVKGYSRLMGGDEDWTLRTLNTHIGWEKRQNYFREGEMNHLKLVKKCGRVSMGIGPFILAAAVSILFGLIGTERGVSAFEIKTGNDEIKVNWDNTVRYNFGVRAQGQDQGLLKSPNQDDGNRNFPNGVVTNRVDLLSEFDAVFNKDYGFRISGAFWYDQRYHDPLGNDSVATSNHLVKGKQALGLSSYTNYLYAGPDGELLDAFVFGRFDLGPVPVNIKVGRHTVYWGESLYNSIGSIAYSQMPLDFAKRVAVPGSEVKELFRPLFHLSAQAQITNALTLAAQQFFQWEPFRTAEAGSYLSGNDTLLKGGESVILRPGVFATHGVDAEPDGTKNWGLALRWSPAWLGGTTGIFYRRFTDMQPQVNFMPVPGKYFFSYADGIDLYGISLATNISSLSVGAELSYRRNMPLVSSPVSILPGRPVPQTGDTFGARGDTWQGLVNIQHLIKKTRLFDRAAWNAEFTWFHAATVSQGMQYYLGRNGYNQIDQVTDHAVGFGANFTPTWFQVFPGMDLSMPLSFGLGLYGNSAVSNGSNKNAGSWSAGLSLDVFRKYNFTLAYVGYFGEVTNDPKTGTVTNGYFAALKDRGWVSFTFKMTF